MTKLYGSTQDFIAAHRLMQPQEEKDSSVCDNDRLNASVATIPPGSVSIDMDGLSDYARGYGFEYEHIPDPVYTHGLNRFLDLFSKHKIRATIFVIGRDTQIPEHAEVLRRAVKEGHELANHTMTHPRNPASLTNVELSREIDEAHRLISELSGTEVCGYRAPCYDTSTCTLNLLRERGYLYDSSVHPTFFGTLIDLIVAAKSGFRRREMRPRTYVQVLAPLRPYYPSDWRYWLGGKGHPPFMELPLSAMPWLRLPFYGTFIQAAGMKAFRPFLKWLRANRCPLNFHYHGIELIDLEDGEIDSRLKVHPCLSKPTAQKIADVDQMLKLFNQAYQMIPLREMATQTLESTGHGCALSKS